MHTLFLSGYSSHWPLAERVTADPSASCRNPSRRSPDLQGRERRGSPSDCATCRSPLETSCSSKTTRTTRTDAARAGAQQHRQPSRRGARRPGSDRLARTGPYAARDVHEVAGAGPARPEAAEDRRARSAAAAPRRYATARAGRDPHLVEARPRPAGGYGAAQFLRAEAGRLHRSSSTRCDSSACIG